MLEFGVLVDIHRL